MSDGRDQGEDRSGVAERSVTTQLEAASVDAHQGFHGGCFDVSLSVGVGAHPDRGWTPSVVGSVEDCRGSRTFTVSISRELHAMAIRERTITDHIPPSPGR